jgi:WD40 repeat protein
MVGQIPTRPTIQSLVYSPNGKLLAATTTASGAISVWDMDTMRFHPGLLDPDPFFRAEFSRDNRTLILDRLGRPVVDWKSGAIIRRHAVVEEPRRPFRTQAAISPDEKHYAVPDRQGKLTLIDAMTGATVRVLSKSAGIGRPRFSADSRRLAYTDVRKTIHVVDLTRGEDIAEFPCLERGGQEPLLLSSNGDVLAAPIRWREFPGTRFRIWDVKHKKELAQIDVPNFFLEGAALSPNGRVIAGGGGRDLRELRVETEVRLYDSATGGLLSELPGHSVSVRFGGAHCAFSPDSRWIATGDALGRLRLWEVLTGHEVFRFEGHQSFVMPSFSPDGRLIVAASHDAPCLIWDVFDSATPVASVSPDELWRQLAHSDPKSAFLAFRELVKRPSLAMETIRQKVTPVPSDDPARIEKLLDNLNSSSFAGRERASAELLQIGQRIEKRLMEVRDRGSAEVRSRIDAILQKLTRPSPARVLFSRALGILETIASPESLKLITELAAGNPVDPRTIEAAESRDRLLKRGVN